MKQILIILILALTLNNVMGNGKKGWGIVIQNCPTATMASNGEFICIDIENGYVPIILETIPEQIPPIPGLLENYKVDFSSIDGFVDHGIPLLSLVGGYTINVPASEWTYSTFFFYVWLKDEKGRIVETESFKNKNIDICPGSLLSLIHI